jgi:hypothetical protein
MCDYSLGGLPNRLAVEGEELIVHRFPTGSIGLAPPADLIAAGAPGKSLWERIKSLFVLDGCTGVHAVCIPPGASLVLKDIPPDLQRKWKTGERESVIFAQTSAEVNTYRDAVYFRNGKRALLQELREGMHVTVLSLGSDAVDQPEAAELEQFEVRR